MNIQGIQLEVRHIAGADALAPIIFLHEGLGSVSLWTQRGLDWPLALCQATGRSGVVYSRRGYGQSDPAPLSGDALSPGRKVLPPDYMQRQAWDVLPALLSPLNIHNPVLLGHSDGATIALLYASRLAVAACIAIAPHVVVESVATRAIAQAREAFEAGDVVSDLKRRLSKHHADAEGAFRQWSDVWLSGGFASFDIRADCSRVTAPLLLVQGLNDEYGTMLQLDEIAMAAPHAQQLRLAGCAHSPHRDQPQQCIERITEFLKFIS